MRDRSSVREEVIVWCTSPHMAPWWSADRPSVKQDKMAFTAGKYQEGGLSPTNTVCMRLAW